MDMILKIARFHILAFFPWWIFVIFMNQLANVLFSLAAIKLTHPGHPVGCNDMIAMLGIFAVGMLIMPLSFKYILSQGVSRKRYFLAVGMTIAILAAILALLAALVYVISLRVTNVWMIYESLYRNQRMVDVMLWEFGALFFLAVLGWFISIVYYVSGPKTKISLFFAPFIVAPLMILINRLADGAMFRAIGSFLAAIMGFSSGIPHPFVGMMSMLLIAVVLSGPSFLLFRRVQAKS